MWELTDTMASARLSFHLDSSKRQPQRATPFTAFPTSPSSRPSPPLAPRLSMWEFEAAGEGEHEEQAGASASAKPGRGSARVRGARARAQGERGCEETKAKRRDHLDPPRPLPSQAASDAALFSSITRHFSASSASNRFASAAASASRRS